MCFEAIPSFAFSVSHIIKSIFGKNKKALALDLDNTLWGGVVGDDGVDGIEIGQETGVSQSYYEFQTYVKQLKSLGIVLTVCSKNDHENAIAGLNHPEGALRPDDFVIIKANWENKDRNIAETAAELNILPDSIPQKRKVSGKNILRVTIRWTLITVCSILVFKRVWRLPIFCWMICSSMLSIRWKDFIRTGS